VAREAASHAGELDALRVQTRDVLQRLVPEQMWKALTEHGRDSFARDVLTVLVSDEGIEDVIEAWYRTWLLIQDPDFQSTLERIGKTPEELEETVYTLDDLKAMLSG
jgi:hypothetical protein